MNKFLPLSAGLLLVLTGCPSQSPSLGEVQGVVTAEKSPVTHATIVFENREEGVAVSASLAPDGSYRLKTHQGYGLPPGTYVVGVSPGATISDASQIPLAGKSPPPPKQPAASAIPKKYHSTATSPLKAEVKAGSNPKFNFDLAE